MRGAVRRLLQAGRDWLCRDLVAQRGITKANLDDRGFHYDIFSKRRRYAEGQDRSTGVTFETKDFKVTAAYASGYTEVSGTSSDGTHEDDPGETLPPGGIGSSRKRPKKEKRQPPARKNMKTAEVEKETLMLENGKNQAEIAQEETTQSLIPTPVRIVMFAIFVFVIFVHVINRLIQVVCS
ncbi:unnamed protein product [Bubo scandiacus]